MVDFLLEIGFEEFPPSFLKKSADELSSKIVGLLVKRRIFHRSVRTIYTPRRIGVLILGLTRKQKSQTIEIQGPPKKLAFNENDQPTEMLQGFMRAHDLTNDQIAVKKIKKGEYVCGKKDVAGADTEDILYKEIPKILEAMEFPKVMIWTKGGTKFPRPIRWILALLDRRPLKFKFAGVRADRHSRPNQHFSFKPIRLEKPREYINFLRHGGVVVDPNERRKLIVKRMKKAIEKTEGKPLYTKEMIEEINCTTEYPEAVVAEFDEKYLELPEEVLLTVLKAQGNLIWLKPTNKFVCIFSAKKKALQNVKKGYTLVVGSKLYDALFYFQNDLKQGMGSMEAQTKRMMWLNGLGSLYDKAARLSDFADFFKKIPDLNIETLKRAASLCKADLLSEMIREKDFTSLQGIMGGYYAQARGEEEAVVAAIKEHYLPVFAGDKMPSTREGAALSICDKIDNVVGAFLSGNRPSGSSDPLAIRRNGYAAVNLIDTNSLDISLFDAVKALLKLYKKDIEQGILFEFINERSTRFLLDKKYRYDEINAVLAQWAGDIVDARMRCAALKQMRGKTEFTKLVIGQKRVRNILKGQKKTSDVKDELLKKPAEKTLYQKGHAIAGKLETMVEQKNYSEALKLLLEMRTDIDKFFDDVMVMCDDMPLRNNRLALVSYINDLFLKYADLSQIVIEGEKD
ncbi:MAG: glycine--tRNA ligase subunit beta [bacterium]